MRRADLAVYGPDGTLRLVVEVQPKKGASAQWIAELRQNLYQFDALPHAPYFLLALPEYLHLWKAGTSKGEHSDRATAPPDYTAETERVLAPYLGKPPLVLGEISAFGLEILLSSWLNDLVSGYYPPELTDPSQDWLRDSGLYAAIKRGKVAVEALA